MTAIDFNDSPVSAHSAERTRSMSNQSFLPCWFSRVAAPSPVGPPPMISVPTCIIIELPLVQSGDDFEHCLCS